MPFPSFVGRLKAGSAFNSAVNRVGMHGDSRDAEIALTTYIMPPLPLVRHPRPSATETKASVDASLRMELRIRGGMAMGTRLRATRVTENRRRRLSGVALLPRGLWPATFPNPVTGEVSQGAGGSGGGEGGGEEDVVIEGDEQQGNEQQGNEQQQQENEHQGEEQQQQQQGGEFAALHGPGMQSAIDIILADLEPGSETSQWSVASSLLQLARGDAAGGHTTPRFTHIVSNLVPIHLIGVVRAHGVAGLAQYMEDGGSYVPDASQVNQLMAGLRARAVQRAAPQQRLSKRNVP